MPIKIDHVTLFNADKRGKSILQDVTCELADGTITLLVGQTGAGKSSLLDVLTGLRQADEGSVQYDEQPLWDGKRMNDAVQARIGVVFQFPEHQLFARTVEKEFAYSLRALRLPKTEVQARTRKALEQMGLPLEISSHSPLTLSGGQKRRVALGTTFATQPKWLFLDEPTAGLDPQSVHRLVSFLCEWKQQTQGGIVMATHDLDAMFPIADRVIVVDQGRILAHMTPQDLCANPSILIQARIGLPSSTQIALALAKVGIDAPQVPVSAVEMAKAIARGLDQQKHVPEGVAPQQVRKKSEGEDDAHAHPPTPVVQPFPEQIEKPISIVHTLDPRAKWAFYILFSIGILLQGSWLGLLIAGVFTVAAILLSRVTGRELLKVIKPFLFFIFFTVILSGIRIGDVANDLHIGRVGFDIESALYTLKQLCKVLLVMVLGVLLSATTSQLRMKRGLEQSLSALKRFKLPVEAFSLATSLMLRFIPVIMKELERFSRITRARGKSTAKLGALRLRDVNVIVIPLLISVLQLGEDLSLAMEARGYSRFGIKRTSSIQLRMNRVDRLTLVYGVVLFVVLLTISRF